MKKILITGGNGLLGTKLISLLLARGEKPISLDMMPCLNEYLGVFPFYQCDVSDYNQLKKIFFYLKPDIVIHTAAMTNVDKCEAEKKIAWSINVEGTSNVAKVSEEIGSRVIYVSTEYVFDGHKGPYNENDKAYPIGYYGLTKFEGEKELERNCKNYAIGRTTVLYGWASHIRLNFVTWVIKSLKENKEISVVNDQIGSPTLADNLASMLLPIAYSFRVGIYNTVGGEILDRYSFALRIAEEFNLNKDLIKPITTCELNQPAPRPLKAGLLMDKFKKHFPETKVFNITESLEVLKQQLPENF